jgi:hypothetical protein
MALTQVASGLIASVAASTLTGTQTIPRGTLPTGSVLQVVQTTWNTYQSSSSSTYADLNGSSISITPLFSTSKVMVLINLNNCGKATNNTYLNVKLLRNGSDVILVANGVGYTNTTIEQNLGVSFTYLDSPLSTSAQTYKLQIASGGNNATAWVNNYQGAAGYSSVTLMEIAA